MRRIVLVGANDFSGGPEASLTLSLRRAEAAQSFLVQEGVDASRIRVEGHGTTARVPNPRGRRVAANRRVDIHVDRGTDPLPAQAQGSALESRRFRRQDPHHTYGELVDLLLQLQSLRGPIPVAACNQLTHMTDGLDRARAQDPTVPDVHEIHGPLIRRLRLRCQSLVPRQRPHIDLPDLEPPRLLDRIQGATGEQPF